MNSNWGTVPAAHVVVEVLLPDIEAELVGDAQIELRVVLDRVVDQVRERGVRSDRVVVVELGLRAALVSQCVIVELDPGRLATSSKAAPVEERCRITAVECTGVEGVVLDVLAVVLERDAGLGGHIPQVPDLLVGNRIAAVGGIVAEPVRRLDVVGVGSHGLHDPVVTVGRLPARVVEVVEKREALY